MRRIISLLTFFFFSLGSYCQMYILNEDFSTASGTTPPLEWTSVLISGNPTDVWHFDNPGGQDVGFPIVAPFAIFDAGAYSNDNQSEQVALESPSFDASISNFIMLEFDHKYVKGTESTCKIQAFNGTDWVDVIVYTNSISDVTHAIVDISDYTGGITNARLRFIWNGNGNGYWAFDNIKIYGALQLDAGIVSLDNPVVPVAEGIHNVKVTLANYGSQTLTSAIIKWTANGVLQTSYSWNGNIPFGGSQSDITLGNYNFQGSVLVKIWSENPNGQQDLNPSNDTVTVLIHTALCGNYTIGGNNPDFANFTEAVTLLREAGISCPVVFNVRDEEYAEQFVIYHIPGTSPTNTVTFRSESGDSNAVKIHYDLQGYPAVKLNNASYINFSRIGFYGYNSYGLLLENYSCCINIDHCYFLNTDFGAPIQILNGSHDILISSCLLQGGNYGINVDGDQSNIPENIKIVGNVFHFQAFMGIRVELSANMLIEGNRFDIYRNGINIINTKNSVVRSNRIRVNCVSNGEDKGIRLEASDTLSVFNNYVFSNGVAQGTGIWVNGCSNMGLYFNSLNIANTDLGQESQGLWLNGGTQNEIKNNIFNIKTAGYPAVITTSTSGFLLDFNDYYDHSGIIGKYNDVVYFTLQDWQQVTGQDIHSVSEPPFYTTDEDLQMNQILLNNIGIPVPGITYDIDGTLRNTTHPDLGAKEYDPCQPDAGINRVAAPLNPVPQGEQEVKVILQNQGSETLSSAIINWMVNDQLQSPYTWIGNLPVNGNAEITIGSYYFEGGIYQVEVWTTQPNEASDCNKHNDTCSISRATPLCGVYTIGGDHPDFANFTEVVTVLNLAGISCPVIFNVRDGGYTDHPVFINIAGTSPTNTITFQSESGDSTAVLMNSVLYPNASVRLNNASYIHFIGIGFTGWGGLSMENQSNHINISHCFFTNYGGGGCLLYVANGSHDIQISSTHFRYGQYGIILSGDESGRPKNIEIINNEFHAVGGVTVDKSRNVFIERNLFDIYDHVVNISNSTSSVVHSNHIKVGFIGDNINKAIRLESTDTLSVYNNYIETYGVIPGSGIWVNGCSNTGVYFNSLNMTNTDVGQEGQGLWLNGGDQNVIKNNIFNMKVAGCPVWITKGTSGFSLDYNDYYNPWDVIGRYNDVNYFTLQDWKQAVGQDIHSVSVPPFYSSDTNLQMNQVLLNNVGIPVPGIVTDIDGTLRNTAHPDLGAKEYDPCQPDAGINCIVAPRNPVPQGEQEVKVILQNQGSGTLSSAIINWMINDELQSPYAWTGNLPVNGNAEVTIGTYDFEGGYHLLTIWTTQPNGADDCNKANDTLIIEKASLLCGNYTIGGDDPDFSNFREAVTVLNTVGISCPVVFTIRDGNYWEKVVINEIPGASKINTVTFRSESGDSTAVMIEFDIYSYSAIKLNNASHIDINGIGFNGKVGVLLENYSSDINIYQCYLTGHVWAMAVTNGSHDVHISSCTFMGGNRGLSLSGDMSNMTKNIEIVNNEFISQEYIGIEVGGSTDILIESNKLDITWCGIYLNRITNSIIRSNWVNLNCQPGGPNQGILLDNTDSIGLYNNYIYTYGDIPGTGIGMLNCHNSELYFNSLNIANTVLGQESRVLLLDGGHQHVIKNNIFSVKTAGYPALITPGTSGFTFDYNDYYNLSGIIGRYNDMDYSNLSEWGQAISGDANSKNVYPNFASEDNPLPYQRELNGAGIPISEILLDINGKIRNDQAPDMGCVEFTIDFGVTDLISPTLDCYHTELDSVTIYLRQFGDVPFIDLKLAYQVNNGPVHYDVVPGTIYNDLVYTFNTTVDMSQDGEYFFKVWLINALDDNINNDTLKTWRYSKPSPVVSFQYDNQCTGTEVRFSGQASIAEPYSIASYEWIFGDGMTSYEQNPTHVYEQAGTYSVIFRAYSNSGCYSSTTADVTFDPDYVPLSLFADIDDEICENDRNGRITLTVSDGLPPYTYFLNEQQQDDHVFSDLSPGTYTRNFSPLRHSYSQNIV